MICVGEVAKPEGYEWGIVKPEGLKFEAEGRERGGVFGRAQRAPSPPAREFGQTHFG